MSCRSMRVYVGDAGPTGSGSRERMEGVRRRFADRTRRSAAACRG